MGTRIRHRLAGGALSLALVAAATLIVVQAQTRPPLAGMMPILDPNDIYAADRPNALSPVVKNFLPRVYVPNTESHTVSVIDPATFKVVETLTVGRQPQHVVPSYDMKMLWVLNDKSDTVTELDPATGKLGKTLKADDPYNMYFTPDGKYSMVIAEQLRKIMFRDPWTMDLKNTLSVPNCNGVDHLDFSADGTYFIASCEFGGAMIKVDVATQAVVGRLSVGNGNMPQDVKLSPDGKVFYVADMMANGLHMIDGETFTKIGFLPVGKGTHGLYVSRDSKHMYVSNRGEGTVSLLDFATRKIATTWKIPGGGSPDMGGVSADGNTLWLSGRYNAEVYAIDTRDGKLLAKIPVGKGPHGLCVYPQPGRYSLGHTGVFR